MNTVVPVSRKRSRIALDPDSNSNSDHDHDHDHEHGALSTHPQARDRLRHPSPALSAIGDTTTTTTTSTTLKRTRTQCELDELAISRPDEAWPFDTEALLSSTRLAVPSGSSLFAHDNWARHVKGVSMFVLCVQGNLQLHYELLCAALPDLYTLSNSLQALVLCHDPRTHRLSPAAPFSLPLVQAATSSCNHFVRLGLLHPLGGGKFPLDALVVIDGQGRRRLVLPFGWGAGKHADTPAGRNIQRRLMGLLRTCVEMLEQER